MHVAMIPTAYRTPFFHAVAERLAAAGHEVCWLSPNRRWARWLERQGTPAERILDVSRRGAEWRGDPRPSEEERRTLHDLETAGGLPFHHLILMDPLLRRRPGEYALKYLAVVCREVEAFLEVHDVRFVFGEQTWAFELAVGQVCRRLGIAHLVPHTVRVPSGRFAFFDGHMETDLVALREPTAEDRRAARRILEDFRQRRPQPSYVAVDRRFLRFDPGHLRLLARHVIDLAGDPHDETSRRPLGLVLDHTVKLMRGHRNRRLRHFERPELPKARPFVYFPLHQQPEASIDIKGQPYSNQLEVVRALVRTLPVTHELFVKEHGVALGNRDRWFYRELLALPGLRLIDPGASSFALTQNADLVVTITGTAAYEAALLGRPAATLAPIFFDRIVRHARFDPFGDSLARLLDRGEEDPVGDERRIEFLADLLARTSPGTCGDALWLPASMEASNLDQVAAGFLEVIAGFPPSPRDTPLRR